MKARLSPTRKSRHFRQWAVLGWRRNSGPKPLEKETASQIIDMSGFAVQNAQTKVWISKLEIWSRREKPCSPLGRGPPTSAFESRVLARSCRAGHDSHRSEKRPAGSRSQGSP